MYNAGFLSMFGRGLVFSEADGGGARRRWKMKELGDLYGGVYTLCLSKLEPLAVPSLAHTYMAADQSLSPFFEMLCISKSTTSNAHICMCHWA